MPDAIEGQAVGPPRILALLLVLAPFALAIALTFRRPGVAEFIYGGLLLLHLICGLLLWLGARRQSPAPRPGFLFLRYRAPELLFSLGALLFLFSYLYATNANMDYVQRFMALHGTLKLAPTGAQERLAACLRLLPLLAIDGFWYILFRRGQPVPVRKALGGAGLFRVWAPPFVILSGILYALAFPSFLRVQGIAPLGYFCLVPLMLCLAETSVPWGIIYGTLAGVLQAMISNYWLGTFNLRALQFLSVVTALEYILFLAVSLAVLRHSRGVGFLVFPAAGTAFDWLRSLGFLGYPWGMLGASQYALTPMIQIASVTGVWGVTFVMMLCNAVLAWYAGGALSRVRRGPSAAIALAAGPDFVVSSETAFVPIIRRWSEEDPAKYPYAALVRDFLAYQKKTGRWRVTGNDDYRFVMHDGSPAPGERLDFSGSVLFSPRGQRGETYHKIHLVPSTEYFPFKKQLPAVYRLLKSFDAYLWEPGDRRVVFRHTAFACSSRQGRRRPASRA